MFHKSNQDNNNQDDDNIKMRSRSPKITIPNPSSSSSSTNMMDSTIISDNNKSKRAILVRITIILVFVLIIHLAIEAGYSISSSSSSNNQRGSDRDASSNNNNNNKKMDLGQVELLALKAFANDDGVSCLPLDDENKKSLQEKISSSSSSSTHSSSSFHSCLNRVKKNVQQQHQDRLRRRQINPNVNYENEFGGGAYLKLDLSNCGIQSCAELEIILMVLRNGDRAATATATIITAENSKNDNNNNNNHDGGGVVSNFDDVLSLDLNNNFLDSRLPIRKVLIRMTRLSMLFLTGNKFRQVPPGLTELTSVTRLSLKSNLLTRVDAAMELPSENLLHLILTDNKISEIKNFGALFRLKKLMLAGNELENVDDLFKSHCVVDSSWAVKYNRGAADNNNDDASKNAKIAMRVDNHKVFRNNNNNNNNNKGSWQKRQGTKCTTMESLELLRLARNNIKNLHRDLHILSEVHLMKKLKWISIAANPVSSSRQQKDGGEVEDEEEESNNILRGEVDLTSRITKCIPKTIGGGASGLVHICLMKEKETASSSSSSPPSSSSSSPKVHQVVLKFFKAVSSDGGDKAEIAALKNLMHSIPHDHPGYKHLLLPLGFADFGKDRTGGGGGGGGGGGEKSDHEEKEKEEKRKRLSCCTTSGFPDHKCPSRFAAVFPALLPGHPLAKPPDIITITQDQYPRSLYFVSESDGNSKPLWSEGALARREGAAGLHMTKSREPPFCLTFTERYRIVRDVLQALHAMHDVAGTLHGDVYAHNIFAAPENGKLRGKLMDFGAAFSFSASPSSPTSNDGQPQKEEDVEEDHTPLGHLPPEYSKYEARAVIVFAEELSDRRRIPVCKLKTHEEEELLEYQKNHQKHGHHHQHQGGEEEGGGGGGGKDKITRNDLEALAMVKLNEFVQEAKTSNYRVESLLHLPQLDNPELEDV